MFTQSDKLPLHQQEGYFYIIDQSSGVRSYNILKIILSGALLQLLLGSVTKNRHNKNQIGTKSRQYKIQTVTKSRHFANAWENLKIGVQIWRKKGGKGVKEKGQQGEIERLGA